MYIIHVLEIYRITLLSNMQKSHWRNKLSFRDLQNYTTLKLKKICIEGYTVLEIYRITLLSNNKNSLST